MLDAPYPPVDGTQPCRVEDPEIFFPAGPDAEQHRDAAAAVCSACPFQPACLTYGVTHAVSGVWGGKTTKQRAAIRTAHGIEPVPMVSRHDPRRVS